MLSELFVTWRIGCFLPDVRTYVRTCLVRKEETLDGPYHKEREKLTRAFCMGSTRFEGRLSTTMARGDGLNHLYGFNLRIHDAFVLSGPWA